MKYTRDEIVEFLRFSRSAKWQYTSAGMRLMDCVEKLLYDKDTDPDGWSTTNEFDTWVEEHIDLAKENLTDCTICNKKYTIFRSYHMCESCKVGFDKENAAYERSEKLAAKQKQERRQLRYEVLQHYCGGKTPSCACCGETQFEFLAIDHINGGGNAHRKAEGIGGDLARWLKKNGYPQGYRVLCHNCNMSRGFHGFCPHEKGAPEIADTLIEKEKLTKIVSQLDPMEVHGACLDAGLVPASSDGEL